MLRVDVAFVALEVVALVQQLRRPAVFARRNEPRHIGQRRRFARTEIRPNDAAGIARRIGGLLDARRVRALGRLARLFQTRAVTAETPTMVEAPQRAVLHPAV